MEKTGRSESERQLNHLTAGALNARTRNTVTVTLEAHRRRLRRVLFSGMKTVRTWKRREPGGCRLLGDNLQPKARGIPWSGITCQWFKRFGHELTPKGLRYSEIQWPSPPAA
jgi:hypothetical protein